MAKRSLNQANLARLLFSIVVPVTSFACAPAFAQSYDLGGLGGGFGTQKTMQGAIPEAPPGGTDAGLGQTFRSGTQGDGSYTQGPQLEGAPPSAGFQPGQSGAATGAPVVGSGFYAPANLSLQTQGGGNKTLPKTTLDSFVKNSGYSFNIYGDEGTDGLPPLNSFTSEKRIIRGIKSPDLTTGHQSGLPEAWGYPQ